MAAALTTRRMLLRCLIAAAALLAGAGHAAAAQRSPVARPAVAVHHGAVAYADGSLTVARRERARRPVAHGSGHRLAVMAHGKPLAYADGLLTGARRNAQAAWARIRRAQNQRPPPPLRCHRCGWIRFCPARRRRARASFRSPGSRTTTGW